MELLLVLALLGVTTLFTITKSSKVSAICYVIAAFLFFARATQLFFTREFTDDNFIEAFTEVLGIAGWGIAALGIAFGVLILENVEIEVRPERYAKWLVVIYLGLIAYLFHTILQQKDSTNAVMTAIFVQSQIMIATNRFRK